MKKLLLALGLTLTLSTPTFAQTRISNGTPLPAGTCLSGAMFSLTTTFIGTYQCIGGVWEFVGSRVPTLRVGNNTPILTSPISYVAGNHSFTGAIGATQMYGTKWNTAWTSSNAMTANQIGNYFYSDLLGAQTAAEMYGVMSDSWGHTSGNITKIEAIRGSVSRVLGPLTQARGLLTYTSLDGATVVVDNVAGYEMAGLSLANGAAVNFASGIQIDSPPSTGGTLNFWRAIEIGNQTTPLTDNSLIVEVTTPNSGYFRLWSQGQVQSEVNNARGYITLPGSGQTAHSFGHNYTGPALTTSYGDRIMGAYVDAFVTPTGDVGLINGLNGEAYLEAHSAQLMIGVQGYVELDGDADVTDWMRGGDFEYGHYSSATIPVASGLAVSGGVGSGQVDDVYDINIESMWDTGGVIGNRAAIKIDPVFEGAGQNWALKYINAGSQVAGITGGGALVDAPEAQSFGATVTITPAATSVRMTCTDAGGCAVTLGESGVKDGQIVRFVNVSTNTCNFADTPGLTELAGAFAAGQWDTLALQYITDRWVELSRSNN